MVGRTLFIESNIPKKEHEMIEYTVNVWAGGCEWYLKNKLHREDGPAAEYSDGSKWWYLNDKLHREDGPAIERVDGSKCWYLNGEEIDQLVFWVTTKERMKETS